jgi:hypothetical protein
MKRGRGRPQGALNRTTVELKTYVRAIAGDDGKVYLDMLHGIAMSEDKDVPSRLKAIGMLLERGWGKPTEQVELTGRGGEPVAYQFVVARASDRSQGEIDAE